MSQAYELQEHQYDVVVVGAGGAGLRATMGLAATGRSQAVGGVVFALISVGLARRLLAEIDDEKVRPDPLLRHQRIFQVFQHRR